MRMRRQLSKLIAVALAIGGVALVATAFQGLVQVDGTLQAATRDMRERQRHHVIDVKYRQAPGCPVGEPTTRL